MMSIVIPGEPHAQQRQRYRLARNRAGQSFARGYQPAESRNWKATAQAHMRTAMGGLSPLTGPVVLAVTAFFTCPRSEWRKRDPRPRRWHAKKPDADNVLKAVKDAATGVLWLDDCQVAKAVVMKFIAAQGDPPRVEVLFGELHTREGIGDFDNEAAPGHVHA